MFVFGVGSLVLKPVQNLPAGGNPTPFQMGTMQECSTEFSASQKELYGKNQFPVAIARTQAKVNFKAKIANITAKGLNDYFFGGVVTTGQTIGVIDESHVAGTTVTIAPPASGIFVDDLGVRDGTSGKQMTLVTATPVAGVSYEVVPATGVYTFGTGQGISLVSYSYSVTASGFQSSIPNQPMGSMPIFEAWLANSQFQNPDGAVNVFYKFPQCISSKLTLPFKNEDFTIMDFDFSAFANAAGIICFEYTDE